jgi:hypothetical protein
VFQKIIELKTPKIKILGLTHDVALDRERFVVTGRSADRDGLALFVDTLKKDGLFDGVELPIASYVKSVDIEFSVTLERGGKKIIPAVKPK